MTANGKNERTERGLRITMARKRKGLKQYQLAKRMRISGPMLCMIEAGRRDVSPEILARLEKALGESF